MILYFPSTWRRLAAHFLDQFYKSLLQMPVWVMIGIDFLKTDQLRVHWAHAVYLILVSFFYETISLVYFGATLGKAQWGLKVISRDLDSHTDRKIIWSQAITRYLGHRLSFFFGWSLYAFAFLKANRTHVIDWLAQTQVVAVTERSNRPKIRWILGLGLIFLISGESFKSASLAINSYQWRAPFIVYNNKELKKMIEDIEFQIEYED